MKRIVPLVVVGLVLLAVGLSATPAHAGSVQTANFDALYQSPGLGCHEAKWAAVNHLGDAWAGDARCDGAGGVPLDAYYFLRFDVCGENYSVHKWWQASLGRFRMNVWFEWPEPRRCRFPWEPGR
jgi:hypothetical protein